MATIILGSQWGKQLLPCPAISALGDDTDVMLTRLRSIKENLPISSPPERRFARELRVVTMLCELQMLFRQDIGAALLTQIGSANGVSYSFHLLPSGLVNPKCINFIGSGVVFHVPSFFKELKELDDKGLANVYDRIFVSDRVHIDLDLHAAVDGLEEIELGGGAQDWYHRPWNNKFNPISHLRGYANLSLLRSLLQRKSKQSSLFEIQANRNGIRLAEVFNEKLFESKLRQLAKGYKARYGDLLQYDVEEELARFNEYRPELAKYAIDGVVFMSDAQKKNTPLLVEGANYVTSSSTTLAGICSGLTLNPKKIGEVIGVVKAYTTRVGAGAFKTEDLGEVGNKLQEIGREWGVSTGRRRRTGWLDLVVVKYSASVNFYTALNLTKLDVLDTFETIKIAIAYKDPETGEELPSYPADLDALDRAEVVYHEMPGWNTSTENAKTYYDLPKQARAYVEFIENFVDVKIKWIGTGPDRESMIKRA
ncbi:hypothetical protein G7046_g2275 [Stylonectria norvegica]|nr:hypothetical protein G7046_g2275 [Stylonectria norvegica]